MNEEENEISLLDLLVVVVENVRLLVLGPLAIGLVALGISFALPQRFVSEAILALPSQALTQTQTPGQAAAIIVSPLVLDPVIEKLQLLEGDNIQLARTKLSRRIGASVGKDGLLRLDVVASKPVQAQGIANLLIDTWLKTTIPGLQDSADLEKRLAYAKVSLDAVRRLQERLTTEGSAGLDKALTRGDAGVSVVAVGELQARYLSDVLNLPRALQGFSRDVVVQPPTLPMEAVGPRKGLIAGSALLGGAVVLLLWVFMRQAWKIAARNPDSAAKQARLLAAMPFRRRAR